MDLSKLTKVHVFIIGAILVVILGVVFYFLGPTKTQKNLTVLTGRMTAAQQVIATRPAKEADLKKAKQEVADAQAVQTYHALELTSDIPASLREAAP